MLKLTTDKHEASRGLSATAELLVVTDGMGLLLSFFLLWVVHAPFAYQRGGLPHNPETPL